MHNLACKTDPDWEDMGSAGHRLEPTVDAQPTPTRWTKIQIALEAIERNVTA